MCIQCMIVRMLSDLSIYVPLFRKKICQQTTITVEKNLFFINKEKHIMRNTSRIDERVYRKYRFGCQREKSGYNTILKRIRLCYYTYSERDGPSRYEVICANENKYGMRV